MANLFRPCPAVRLLLHALAISCALSISRGAAAETIVITDSKHPVSMSAGARVIYLDRASQLKQRLSVGLPTEPALAKAEFKRRLSGPGGTAALQELRHAHQDLVDAWTLKIAKVPAVVVDREYVVYGVSDVAAAVALIHRRMQEER